MRVLSLRVLSCVFRLGDTQRGNVTSPHASSPLVKTFRFLAFAGCLVAASPGFVNAPIGAADEHPPPAKAEKPKEIQSATQAAPDKLSGYRVRSHCVDDTDNSPAAGVRVLLFEAAGRTLPIVQIGETTTDAKGEFEFPNLNPPRDVDGLDRLEYRVVVVEPNWAIVIETIGFRPAKPAEIRLSREQETLSGHVVNARGQPVAGAIAAMITVDNRAIPGILSTTTGADGRFMIDKLPVIRRRDGSRMPVLFQVLHRDYPATNVRLDELPADLKFRTSRWLHRHGTRHRRRHRQTGCECPRLEPKSDRRLAGGVRVVRRRRQISHGFA